MQPVRGIKKWLIIVASVLLFGNTLLNILTFGFQFIIPYLFYILPGIFGLIYLKETSKNFKAGVWIASVIAVAINLIFFPSMVNIFHILIYLIISISVI